MKRILLVLGLLAAAVSFTTAAATEAPTGSIDVDKEVDGDPDCPDEGPCFVVDIDCEDQVTRQQVYDRTGHLIEGPSTFHDIPEDTVCVVTETVTAGAAVSYDPAHANTTGVVITPEDPDSDEDQRVHVLVTNTFCETDCTPPPTTIPPTTVPDTTVPPPTSSIPTTTVPPPPPTTDPPTTTVPPTTDPPTTTVPPTTDPTTTVPPTTDPPTTTVPPSTTTLCDYSYENCEPPPCYDPMCPPTTTVPPPPTTDPPPTTAPTCETDPGQPGCSELARTGSDLRGRAGTGLLMVAAGAAMWLVARRRTA